MRTLMLLVLVALSAEAFADPKAGEAKAQLCLLCHKPERAGIPLLESQPAQYLVAATLAFRNGTRTDPQMQPNVARLSPQDVDDIADFFAARAPVASVQAADAAKAAHGEARVRQLGCATCHQPSFSGRDVVPRLAGQSSGYVIGQLEAIVAGRRMHPLVEMPSNSPSEIESVASYFATLR